MAATLTPVKRTADDVHKLYLEAQKAADKADRAAAAAIKAAEAHVEALGDLSRDELRQLAKLRGVVVSRMLRTKGQLAQVLASAK